MTMNDVRAGMDACMWEYNIVADAGSRDGTCMYMEFGEHAFSIYINESCDAVIHIDGGNRPHTFQNIDDLIYTIDTCLYCWGW